MKVSTAKPDSASIGVISDTHGLLRAHVLRLFSHVDLVVHAGDVGSPDVLHALGQLAPVCAVRGNTDHGTWADALPESATVEVADVRILVAHDLHELEVDPAGWEFAAVITGHSHRPLVERRGGVLFLNPGSAGPRRFKLPIACALLAVSAGKVSARLLEVSEDR